VDIAFRYRSFSQEVHFAPGAFVELSAAVDRAGWQRIMLCASHSQRQNGRVDQLVEVLGSRLVAVCDQVQQHVPDAQVEEVAALAALKAVSAVIGLGGGSSIGMAKAVAHRCMDPAVRAAAEPGKAIAVVAIPTTYAGSEMTAVFGVTDTRETPPRKVTVSDARIAPKLVLYDPELTLDLPAGMTASTGINALAHCLEALYSVSRNPISSAAATSAVGHIQSALLRCYRQGDDLEARGEMLLGAHLAGWSLSTVSMGLHHGLCHVLGGTAGLAHGVANSILLPHVLRFNADTTGEQLLPAVVALGVPVEDADPQAAVERACELISEWTGQMHLPQRLRDAGVAERDLPLLAQLGFQNGAVQKNPKPVRSVEEVERLLCAAW
jgi:maleylacetate reductase